MRDLLFHLNIVFHYTMLAGVVYSIAYPAKRIWPPPRKQSWQFLGTWLLFYAAVLITTVLIFLTWNSWIIPPKIRYYIGFPVSLVGGALVSWGIITLGLKNTSGSTGRFIEEGPYRFTRNPQYTGDIILFSGLVLVANSLYVAVPLILQAIIFTITPLTEELWLEEQYGEEYIHYKNRVPRFL